MKFRKLTFLNIKTGWNIKNLQFGNLSLFVGASGVGKTQILRSILMLRRIAAGQSVNGVSWIVEFEESSKIYEWSGKFSVSPEEEDFLFGDNPGHSLEDERLIYKDTGKVIFSRTGSELHFNNEQTVRLDQTKSGIELLKEEPEIAIVNEGFRKIVLLDMSSMERISVNLSLGELEKTVLTIKDIKKTRNYSAIDRLYLVQKNHLDKFLEIQEAFKDVFPLVEKIDFDIHRMGSSKFVPTLKIKEENVDSWIDQRNISNGMLRTLTQIVTLALAEEGDVILIDEFENGLGINCIEDLAEMAVQPDVNVQIIMTSHHPYIINAIPYRDWRIVSRHGSDVRVNTAAELRIGEGSRHEAFMQLVQTSEFTSGQS